MALILKDGKIYNDPHGNSGTDYYCVIDKILIDKKVSRAKILFDIYKDQDARINKKTPVASGNAEVTTDNYPTYFSKDLLEANNVYKQAYLFLIQDNVFVDWKSDEA